MLSAAYLFPLTMSVISFSDGVFVHYELEFTAVQLILSNALFFSVSVLALVFGALVSLMGRAYRIPWLKISGILYIILYAIFITSVILGALWVGNYFSFYSLFPTIASMITLFMYSTTPYLNLSSMIPLLVSLMIPTLVSLVPLFFFSVGIHSLKRKTGISDLDGVIFCVIAGLIIGPLVSALGYIVLGYSLGGRVWKGSDRVDPI